MFPLDPIKTPPHAAKTERVIAFDGKGALTSEPREPAVNPMSETADPSPTGDAAIQWTAPPQQPRDLSPSEPAHGPLTDTLACALGAAEGLKEPILHGLAERWLSGWHVAEVAASTDLLWDVAQAQARQWTTLLVTHQLQGSLPLGDVLFNIRRQWPQLRVVVLLDSVDSAPNQALIRRCADAGIFNLGVGNLTYTDLVQLVTTSYAWETVMADLLAEAEVPESASAVPRLSLVPGLGGSVGGSPPVAPVMDPEITAAQTIAVISGKGGVGKTSFIANCLVAAAPWGAVGIDADFVKPTLHLAFHSPENQGPGDLYQLILSLSSMPQEPPVHPDTPWSARQQKLIHDWVKEAELVNQGVRLVAGPARNGPVPVSAPPGLVTGLAEASRTIARLTLIDTPGSTNEDSWVEAVSLADWVVLVTSPDYAAILESVDVLNKLDYLKIPRSRVWLVVSQRGRAGYSTTEIVQTQLKLPLLAVIPEDRVKWDRAWRLHRPLALNDRGFWNQIVMKMTGIEPDRPTKKNPFHIRRAKR